MITAKQKKQLIDLGYSKADISEMKPQQAHEILATAAADRITLADLATEKQWVAWQQEPRGDKLTKIPKDPPGGNARCR